MRNHVSVKTGIALLAVLFVNAAIAAMHRPKKKPVKRSPTTGQARQLSGLPRHADHAGCRPARQQWPATRRHECPFPRQEQVARSDMGSDGARSQYFMPPFGKHKILTEEQLDKVVDFVYGL